MPIVIVPAKPLARAKARLSPALSAEERRTLCLAMLADVCSIAEPIGRVIVVCSDSDAEHAARSAGAEAVADPTPEAGLNPSLEAAIPQSDDGVLVVASDVPACKTEDLAAIAAGDGVKLAPDGAGTGTNALWRLPGDAIPLAFGESSAERHAVLAMERGLTFEIVRRPGLALDVDLPGHLKEAWDGPIGPRTRLALKGLGFPDRFAAL